MSKPVV